MKARIGARSMVCTVGARLPEAWVEKDILGHAMGGIVWVMHEAGCSGA